MKHSISNTYLKIEVQQQGAELCSIKSVSTDKEYMWNADPEVWGSFAPVLFPIIGSLKNGIARYENESYHIPKHGFVRHNNSIELKSKTPDRLNFTLKHNDDLLKLYPFKFEFQISFQLVGNKVVIAHKVLNLDDKEMLFSLGGHPAFKCPVNSDEQYTDYYLEFENEESVDTYDLTADGLVKDSTKPVLIKTNILPLTNNLFDNDALIFKNLKSRKVSLKSTKSEQELCFRFNDFNYLGIWAKPGAQFVCIEPWLGIADNENTDGQLVNKEGILKLAPCESFTAQYSIEIDEV